MKTIITVETIITSNIDIVWNTFISPKHIKKWHTASPEWHTTKAENNLIKGGGFSSRMEAKDGSFAFDFGGVYDKIITNQLISYTLDDGRSVSITFTKKDNTVLITEAFEPENQNPVNMQKQGWQAILDNFKKYVETV
ncbi:SRPBCC domain-containing protein [Lacinutrix mariniflava]|uniref:SRPBCC domain-containing protein n=1 Tax=Lacinutrix mariniflava TaxID=342955 RepID=UPI0006E2BD2A|nr:SRPBCC domain-containing protein [Lacinutrix mariniflava]